MTLRAQSLHSNLIPRLRLRSRPNLPSRRFKGTNANRTPPSGTTPNARIERLNARLPGFLRPYTKRLIDAPVSHVTSFLILHEITAVVPLFGLFGLFHYSNWLPETWTEGKWVKEGTEKFGRYFRRKGWIADDEDNMAGKSSKWTGEQGVRAVLEVAVAYAITKALLPARLILSVWATPWVARVFVLPITRLFGRLLGRRGR